MVDSIEVYNIAQTILSVFLSVSDDGRSFKARCSSYEKTRNHFSGEVSVKQSFIVFNCSQLKRVNTDINKPVQVS